MEAFFGRWLPAWATTNASMDTTTKILYGAFPRELAFPERVFVRSAKEFDLTLEDREGKQNIYSSLATADWITGKPKHCDKVSIDFDSPHKIKGQVRHDDLDSHSEPEIFRKMESDDSIAEDIIGPCLDDVRRLIQATRDKGIKTVTVFTGLGFHVHGLFKPKIHPKKEMNTTARKWITELNLSTADPKPVGDVSRILRVPNCERIAPNGLGCGIKTIPLGYEDLDNSPAEILRMARGPHNPESYEDMVGHERPEMSVCDEFVEEEREIPSEEERDAQRPNVTRRGDLRDDVIDMVDLYVRMPCLKEQILRPNPTHDIRQNLAVHLFNYGFSVREAFHFIEALDWVDFDPNTTRYQLEQIYRSGYSDQSCRTMMENGYCTYPKNPTDCPTYNWSGGKCEWQD